MDIPEEHEKTEWCYVTRADQLAIRRLFSHLPASFEGKYDALIELRALFHMTMAETLEPFLRIQLQAQPQETLSERRTLKSVPSEWLGNLGLTLQCPSTGQAVFMEVEHDEQMRANTREILNGEKIDESSLKPPSKRYVLIHENPTSPGYYLTTYRSEELPSTNVMANLDWTAAPVQAWSRDTESSEKGR